MSKIRIYRMGSYQSLDSYNCYDREPVEVVLAEYDSIQEARKNGWTIGRDYAATADCPRCMGGQLIGRDGESCRRCGTVCPVIWAKWRKINHTVPPYDDCDICGGGFGKRDY